MYDPPHLLKSIRNNFKRYPVEVNGKVALWDHVVQFYSRDNKQKVRLAPKLKLHHINLGVLKKCELNWLLKFSVTLWQQG